MAKDDALLTKTDGNQFVISYELLALLRWLIEHDTDKLKKIITKAQKTGLHGEITKIENNKESQSLDDIHLTIVEFFGLLESLLIESMNEKVVEKAIEKNLMPAIDHIDSSICDDATVRFSVEKATSKMDHNPEEDPQDVLYKELLKRWKPSKKNLIN
jgi:uncharacterized membrane protein